EETGWLSTRGRSGGAGVVVADAGATPGRGSAQTVGGRREASLSRSGLEAACEPVAGLAKEYDEFVKRLLMLPTVRDWLQLDVLPSYRSDAEALRERVDLRL